jgi:hypothetical protein
MNGELWQSISALDQHLRRLDQVLGLTNQLVPRATDSGVGTDCEVEDIEHSEESEEGASEEEDVWSRCVTTSNPYGL